MANRYNGKISRSVTAILDLITGASGGTIGTFLTPRGV